MIHAMRAMPTRSIAVQRLVGIVGMQGGQAQMAGLGKRHGVFHGRSVADFTHQDHIGRLAQCILQRRFPAVGVKPHFSLRYHAVFVGMHKLHRVFYGDDVAVRVVVAPIHHGRQRCRFTRPGGPHHDAQAALGLHDFLENLGHAQPVYGGQEGRNHAQHQSDLALLDKYIDAKATDLGRRDGKVAFLGALELGYLLVAHDGARQGHRVRRVQRLGRHLGNFAIDLDRGWKVGRDEQVAAIAADHQPQQVIDELGCLIAFHGINPGSCPESWPCCAPRLG